MTLDEKNRYLKTLDSNGFLELGSEHVAYVREIEWLGAKHFAVHSADGSPITIATSKDIALSAIHSNDMEAITLH